MGRLFNSDKQHVKRMRVNVVDGVQGGANGTITVRLWNATGRMQNVYTPVEVLFEDMDPATAPTITATKGALLITRGDSASAPVDANLEVIARPEIETATKNEAAILTLSIESGDQDYNFAVRCGNATYCGTIKNCHIDRGPG